MKLQVYFGFLAVSLLLAAPNSMWADVVLADSQAGLGLTTMVCNSGIQNTSGVLAPPSGCTGPSTSGASVAINPDPSWKMTLSDDPNAVWISNYDSGYNGDGFQYASDIAVFALTVDVTVPVGYSGLTIDVLADDTAGVFVTGGAFSNTEIWSPKLTDQNTNNGPCALAVVGCIGTYEGITTLAATGGTTYHVRFEPYQQGTATDTGFNPFGLMFSVSATPDGGTTLMLLGAALAGLETLRRRLRV